MAYITTTENPDCIDNNLVNMEDATTAKLLSPIKMEHKNYRRIRLQGHLIYIFSSAGLEPGSCGTCGGGFDGTSFRRCVYTCCAKTQCLHCCTRKEIDSCPKLMKAKGQITNFNLVPSTPSSKPGILISKSCTICKKKYISQRSMKRHMRYHFLQEQRNQSRSSPEST